MVESALAAKKNDIAGGMTPVERRFEQEALHRIVDPFIC
jgi:hypothetical protein